MKRTLTDILEHMVEDCEDIADAVIRVGDVHGMDADRNLRKAIVMSILNLGELTKLLEMHLDLANTGIDWKGLKGMREIAAHRYKTMRSIIIWTVATEHVPEILLYLRQRIDDLQR